MTTRSNATDGDHVTHWRWIAALPLMAGLLGGCGTTTIDDAVPGSASATSARAATAPEYPNLNIRPSTAGTQFTPEEKAANTTQLQSIRERQAASLRTNQEPDRSAELRRLAGTHGDAALKEIEAE
ncbi:hypothetical protein [Aquamicrobium sp. LC103]|uniref:hypothetical protein n=1 Tax=Aquamicrobium sp. LC103 TaxID=1120658 RepID=UPI00069A0B40|nr:hypothetical protein [Aquamicrobium sp. LC103]TKT76792.1 hypothetical protein XW59_015110 [Aquamicrobium sp. LC103]